MDADSIKLLAVFTVEFIAVVAVITVAAYGLAAAIERLSARKSLKAPEEDFATTLRNLELNAGIDVRALLKKPVDARPTAESLATWAAFQRREARARRRRVHRESLKKAIVRVIEFLKSLKVA